MVKCLMKVGGRLGLCAAILAATAVEVVASGGHRGEPESYPTGTVRVETYGGSGYGTHCLEGAVGTSRVIGLIGTGGACGLGSGSTGLVGMVTSGESGSWKPKELGGAPPGANFGSEFQVGPGCGGLGRTLGFQWHDAPQLT